MVEFCDRGRLMQGLNCYRLQMRLVMCYPWAYNSIY